MKQRYDEMSKKFFSHWNNTLTKTLDVSPKAAILAFAYSFNQNTQCTMEIFKLGPETIEELYTVREAQICVKESLIQGNIHMHPNP